MPSNPETYRRLLKSLTDMFPNQSNRKKKISTDILPYNLGSLSTNFANLGLTAGYNDDKYSLNLNKTVSSVFSFNFPLFFNIL